MKRKNNSFNDDFEDVIECLNMYLKHDVIIAKKDITIFEDLIYLLPFLKKTNNHPDADAFYNGELLLLEHFSFDNSETTAHGGSLQNIEKNKNDKFLDNQISVGVKTAIVKEHVVKTGQSFVKNLTRQFEKHASKIQSYIKDYPLSNEQNIDTVIVGFIIEDTSPFGSQILIEKEKTKQKYEVLAPFAKELLDLFEKTELLDFIVFTTSRERNEGVMAFMSKESISVFRNYQVEVSKLGHFLYEDSFVVMHDIKLQEIAADPNLLKYLHKFNIRRKK